jgi:signal transduction histidine kinase
MPARAKGIRLVANAPRGLMLLANRDLVRIILGNLTSNAIRYSPAGSTVTVTAEDEGGAIHLVVRDEGMGIEAEELEKVFEEFYRTRRAREREKDGTGLGLAITKRAVEALDGRMQVHSEVDRGSAFHVFLPKRSPGGEQHG